MDPQQQPPPPPPPPPVRPPPPPPPPPRQHGTVGRLVRRVGGAAKTYFAVVGFVGTIALYGQYRNTVNDVNHLDDQQDDKDKKKTKNATQKSVLTIPFHRLEIVEKKKSSLQTRFQDLSESLGGDSRTDDTKVQQIEIRELVDLIHRAASDDKIGAIYATFGGDQSLVSRVGWANLEEIRTALQVFKESHRRHMEPTIAPSGPRPNFCPLDNKNRKKLLLCYGDSFESDDPGNKAYYLASVFTRIYMQNNGALNLFGMMANDLFLRGLFEKYGVGVHVFKNGTSKCAPNVLTETKYDPYHRAQATHLMDALDHNITSMITSGRIRSFQDAYLQQLAPSSTPPAISDKDAIGFFSSVPFWKHLYESGTFPAESAIKAGLIDGLSSRDPLGSYLDECLDKRKKQIKHSVDNDEAKNESTKDEECASCESRGDDSRSKPPNPEEDSKTACDEKSATTCVQHLEKKFDGKRPDLITLNEYAKSVAKTRNAQEKQDRLKRRSEKYPVFGKLLSALGLLSQTTLDMDASKKRKEKIALLTISGPIMNDTASKVIASLRRIRSDTKTKCLVLRVASPGGSLQPCESILQELKSLDIPVVVSFGDVSASGGYYISTAADRIFASKNTFTGSIGIFGVRFDFTGLAAKYGITAQHISGDGRDLAGLGNPFIPMNKKMQDNLSAQLDRGYLQFKDVVAKGRKMTMDDVEDIAQGRVYTGDEAKSVGLVDEIGGIHRALAYAVRNHTMGGPEIVAWPKKVSMSDRLFEACAENDLVTIRSLLFDWLAGRMQSGHVEGAHFPSSPSHVPANLDMDKMALQLLLNQSIQSPNATTNFPTTSSNIFLTYDENAALQCLLKSTVAPIDEGAQQN